MAKSHPEISVRCYTKAAIPHRQANGLIMADLLSEHMNLGSGSTAGMGFEGMNPTISDAWTQQYKNNFDYVDDTLNFIRLIPNGTIIEGGSVQDVQTGDVAGFTLMGRIAYLDSKIGRNKTTIADGGYTNINWTEVQGTWRTALPPGAQKQNCIVNSGSGITAKAITEGNLPANRQHRIDVQFVRHGGANNQAAFRHTWGNETYSIVLRHGQAATVEKKVSGSWIILRTMSGAGECNLHRSYYSLVVRRLAGRLVVGINGHYEHILEVVQGVGENAPIRAINSEWPAGKVGINCYNVRAITGISIIKYATAGSVPFSGSFARTQKRRVPPSPNDELSGQFGGWTGAATVAVATSQVDYDVQYICTLTASLQGIDTPFVDRVFVRLVPHWTQPTLSYLDIAPAVISATFSSAMPPIMAGDEVRLDVDRQMLDSIFPSWGTYVNQYHPVEFQCQWIDTDGTAEPWIKLFRGYIHQLNTGHSGIYDKTMSLVLRDPVMRLQEENARVDHRYPPLDVYVAQRAAQGATEVYGHELVQEILGIALGDAAGISLNNGLYYFPDSHYPLISSDNDTAGYFAVQSAIAGQPPTSGRFLFPAPYGDDVLGWIKRIAQYDHGEFFYGWPQGYNGEWPVPIYGRILNLIAGRPTIVIPDAIYVPGDGDRVLQSIENETRPDRNINRVLVWGNFGQNDLDGYLPAERMAEARLSADDINAPEKTWERTLVIQDDLAAAPGSAEAIAFGLIGELRNRYMEWPRVVFRGDATVTWGHKLQLKQQADCPDDSDTSMGLTGKTFRVERIDHIFDMGSDGKPKTFVSVAYTRPVSASGW
jgi:hypothetical protein